MKYFLRTVLAVMFITALTNVGLAQICAKLATLNQNWEAGWAGWQATRVASANDLYSGTTNYGGNYTWGGNQGYGWGTNTWCLGTANSPYSSGGAAVFSENAAAPIGSGHREHVLTSPAVNFTGGCDPTIPAPSVSFSYCYLPSSLQGAYGTVEMNIEVSPDITVATPQWYVIAAYTDMGSMATGAAFSVLAATSNAGPCVYHYGSFSNPGPSDWKQLSVPFPVGFGSAANAAVRFRVFNEGGSSGACWFPIWLDDIKMDGSFNKDLAVKTIGTFVNGGGFPVKDSAVISPTATFQTTMQIVQVGTVDPASTGNTAMVYYQIYGLGRPGGPYLYSDSVSLPSASPYIPLPNVQCGAPTGVTFKQMNPTVTQAPGEYTVRTIVKVSGNWDCNSGNDTVTADLVVGYDYDVKPLAVLVPTNTRQEDIVSLPQNPQVLIRNLGLNSVVGFHVRIDIYYPNGTLAFFGDVVESNTLISGATDRINFSQFNPTSNGFYKIRVITQLGSDLNKFNDTLIEFRQFYWKYDVKADSIIVNLNALTRLPEVPQGGTYRPVGRFENNGASFVSPIPITFEAWKLPISPGDTAERTIIDTMPELNINDGMRRIAFYAGPTSNKFWTPQQTGDYLLKMYANYPTDGDRTNDTVKLQVTSIPRLLGSYSVGFGQNIATMQSALDSLNYRGVRGNVTFQLVDNNYQQNSDLNFQKVRFSGPSARVAFKPAAGVSPTITLNNGSRLVFDLGASYMGFDGSNSQTTTPNRALTVIQAAPGTPAFYLSRGASSDKIVNCNIQTANINGQNPTKLNQASIGIFLKNQYPTLFVNNLLFTNDTLSCNGNLFDNNDIEGFRTGIWAQGLAPVFVAGSGKYTFHWDTANVISNNVMKYLGRAGILATNQYGLKVFGNDISLIENSSVNSCTNYTDGSYQQDQDANVIGIGLGGVRTACLSPWDNADGVGFRGPRMDSTKGYAIESQVYNNKIHDLNGATGVLTRAVGIEVIQDTVWANALNAPYTFQTPGIHPAITHNVVWNNMIWNLDTATTRGEVIGILFDSRGLSDATIPSPNTYFSRNDSIVNNTILLRGNGANSRTTCLDLGHAYRPMVWNNIFENDVTAGTRSLITYAIQNPEIGLDADHNLYWFGAVGNANNTMFRLQVLDANGNFREQKTFNALEQWQAATLSDMHSVYADPKFKSTVFPVDLHIKSFGDNVWSPAHNQGAALYSSVIKTDIDGEVRGIGGVAYDIGADELSGKQFANDMYVLRITNPVSVGSLKMITNPVAVSAIVQNVGTSTQLQKSVFLTITNVQGNVVVYRDTIQTDFKVGEIKALTFGLDKRFVSYLKPFKAVNGNRYVFLVAADADMNTVNDTLSTTQTFVVQANAICVSWSSAPGNGTKDKDSVVYALKRWGFQYDLFDRNVTGLTTRQEDISYAAWPTVIYCVQDGQATKPLNAGGATYNFALSYDERQQLSKFLNLGTPGPTGIRRSLVIAGKDIASYHDVNPDQTVRDTFFTRQLLHEVFVNFPTATTYAGQLAGVRIEPNVREQLGSSGFTGALDVDAMQPIFVKNGTAEYAYSYKTRTNIANGLDTAAGVTFWGQLGTVNYNIITYGFDWRQLSRLSTDTTSGIARVMLNSLDFIQKNGGCIVPCLTPVELSWFEAKLVKHDVALTWESATELNVTQYNVERKPSDGSAWKAIAHGSLPARGVNGGGAQYSTIDPSVPAGVYEYRLAYVHNDGHVEYSATRQVVIPAAYALYQNYPNPFNPTTQIDYVTMEQGLVKLILFDVVGNVVRVFVNELQDAGNHGITFDASSLSSGVYSYRLEVNGFTQTRRMMLMK